MSACNVCGKCPCYEHERVTVTAERAGGEALAPSSHCPTRQEREAYELALKYLRDYIMSFDQTDLDTLTTIILAERSEAFEAGKAECKSCGGSGVT
jgi:hypothetical protein